MKRIYVFQAQMENPHLRPGLIDPVALAKTYPDHRVVSLQDRPCPVTSTDILMAVSSPADEFSIVKPTDGIRTKVSDIIAKDMGGSSWKADRFEVKLVQLNMGFLVFVENDLEETLPEPARPTASKKAHASSTPAAKGSESSVGSNKPMARHYTADNAATFCRQVVLCADSDANDFRSTDTGVDDAFIDAVGTDGLWSANCRVVDTQAQVVIKADGATDAICHEPMRLAFGAYSYACSGVFQLFVHFESEIERGGSGPFIVERSFDPSNPEFTAFLDAIYQHKKITVLVGENGKPDGATITIDFAREVRLRNNASSAIRREMDRLIMHHIGLDGADYEAGLAAYNRDHPIEVNPILPSAGKRLMTTRPSDANADEGANAEPLAGLPMKSAPKARAWIVAILWPMMMLSMWAASKEDEVQVASHIVTLFPLIVGIAAVPLLYAWRATATFCKQHPDRPLRRRKLLRILACIAVAAHVPCAIGTYRFAAKAEALTEWLAAQNIEARESVSPEGLAAEDRPVLSGKVVLWNKSFNRPHRLHWRLNDYIRASTPEEVDFVIVVDWLSPDEEVSVIRLSDRTCHYEGDVPVDQMVKELNAGRWPSSD